MKYKCSQVVEWLIGIGTSNPGALEVNNVNQSGLTALDLLLIFPSEAGDREIYDTLRGAGALRAQDIMPSLDSNNHTSRVSPRHPRHISCSSQMISSSTSSSKRAEILLVMRVPRC